MLHTAWIAILLLLAVRAGPEGPYQIILLPGPVAPAAHGEARLHFADSPFGIAVTADGRHRYDIRVTAADLPPVASLGAEYRAYVAWEVTPDLSRWHRLGVIGNGVSTVGTAEWNKFLLVITAEREREPATHVGPTVLHGTSPSGWLQTFLTHPLFRGISQ
ncbi:MAG: hypothetical protein V4503_01530 [Gemmatimonadota bacterium]